MKTLYRILSLILFMGLWLFPNSDARAQLGDTWRIISDNNLNGSIVVELKYAGRISFRNNNGEWQEILTLHQHDGSNYSAPYGEVVTMFNYISDCWICWWDTPEFYLAFRPPTGHYNQDLQLRYEDSDNNEVSFATVQAWKPERLNNVKVSQRKHCNKVELSWDAKPDNVPIFYHSYHYGLKYRIYRDSSHLATVPYNQTHFTDTDVEPGKTYYYQVQYVLSQNLPQPDPWKSDYSDASTPWDGNYGEKTYVKAGASKDRLDAPMQVFTNDNKCGNTVELNWYAYEDTANDNTIDKYLLQQATDADFTENVAITEIEEDSTVVEDYAHEVPLQNTTYYFRLKTMNACGNVSENWSDSDTATALTQPVKPENITANFNNKAIVLEWDDSAEAETNYLVQRKPAGADNYDMSVTLDPNTTRYEDENFSVCTEYTYYVKAVNGCGSSDSATTTIAVQPEPAALFDSTTFEVSKGYYPDRVELTWEVVSGIVDFYQIKRREAGPGSAFEVIDSVNGMNNQYIDRRADAGKLYEYRIRPVVYCSSVEVSSSPVTRTGFRIKAGTVSGKVTYKDGTALKHAQILVTPENTELQSEIHDLNVALDFDGNDYISIPYTSKFKVQDAFTLQMWVKPDSLEANNPLLWKSNGSTAYGLSLKNNDAEVRLITNGDTATAVAQDSVVADTYLHLAGTYDGQELKIFINGKPVDSTSFDGGLELLTEPAYIGTNPEKTAYYNGLIDEILVYNRSLANKEMLLNYNRFLSGTESGLVAYWRADINWGNQLFDYSKSGETFNKNHGQIHGASWSEDIPSLYQLSLKGLTDKKGRYTISYARYLGQGTNMSFTPFYGQHSFSPENSLLYVGVESYYQTLNFTDLSSVKVTGSVQYKDSRCMARGIGLYIDGKPVIRNGQHVKTDNNGEFEIQVPQTGEHRVSVDKRGHYFDPGIWPTDTSYVFSEPVTGIEFKDTTKIRVVGRVVGGLREANKKPALGKSTNNIGRAEIIFRSQMGYGCSTDTAYTDPETGEYKIDLLPLNYIIKDVTVLNNLAINFGTQEIIRLSNYHPLKTVYDTTFANGQADTLVDSAQYNLRRDFIYRTAPRIEVTGPLGDPFIGEESLELEDEEGNPIELDLSPEVTGYPIFFAGNEYTARIFIHEKYTNADNDQVDLVPLKDAKIRINNDIALVEGETDYTKTIQLQNEQDGDTLYTFTAGEPNFLTNSTHPEYNFTKTFKIETEVNSVSADWQPGNAGEADEYYRGYVLGTKSSDNLDFVSAASTGNLPQIISILRDPPGDQSQTLLEQNSSFSSSFSIGGEISSGIEASVSVYAGAETIIPSFWGVPNVLLKVKAARNFSIGSSYSLAHEYENETNYQLKEQISTSGAPELVGTPEDLYFGSLHNYVYGKTSQLTLVENSYCQESGGQVPCIDSTIIINSDTLRIGLKNLYMLVDSIKTTFALTHDHIKNYLIPDLKELRNNLFVTSDQYISKVPPEHPHYGTNNDDPVWGADTTSANPYSREADDRDGPSYRYNGGRNDSVRWYNQKIRAWETLLEQNEREKALANPDNNITFEGGGSQYEQSYSISQSSSNTTSSNFHFEFTTSTEASVDIAGSGVEVAHSISIGASAGFDYSTASDTTVTYGYSLADDDQGDYFSVDITQPNGIDDLSGTNMGTLTGPIFKTVAGRSMCPWEGPLNSSYYNPVGQEIIPGTMQREKPQLNVTPNVQNNVPPDEPAVYQLTIGNASETGETMWYHLKVAEDSNPNGAVLKVDGGKLNRVFEIPGGESYQKTLTLSKTPGVDNYNNIEILLFSDCEWAYHTNGGVFQAVDTVTITAQFIPSCSDIAFHEPANQWVANTRNKDTLWTVIGDYNQNFPNFKKFQMQYKHVSEPNWNGLKTFWNDTSGMNDTTLTIIPEEHSYTMFPWDISQVPDGEYEIRSVSYCPLTKNYTRELRGMIDRIPPHPYGSPQPADGVLSPDDDVYITFNEPLHGGKITKLNMDIRGVLNGAELVHNASLNFDGENDYAEIPAGLAISTAQPFSLELWIKRNQTGRQTVLSQRGTDNDETFTLGFDDGDRFTIQIGGNTLSTPEPVTDQLWHHYACTFNPDNNRLVIFYDGAPVTDKEFGSIGYKGFDNLYLGKNIADNNSWFNGNVHELRLWHTKRIQSQIVANMNKQLTGMEYGLIGYWPLDDAFGSIAREKVHHRHAENYATWDVYPSGNAFMFDGQAQYLSIASEKMIFSEKTDFTISFWFKSADGQNATLVSNGKGQTTGNPTSWIIHTNTSGQILVENNGQTFKAVHENYFDNNWHHFALVVSRYGNTHAYIDGKLQNTTSSEHWTTFGGPKLWVGSRGWQENYQEQHDEFYSGLIDELRIWYVARKYEQIKRDMTHKLSGSEIGLMAYYPFEHYQEDAGVNVLRPTLRDKSDTTAIEVDYFACQPAGNKTFSAVTPNIKLKRPVEKVNYNYSFKEDELMFCIGDENCPGYSNISADELKRIENSTLDVTVKDVYDLNGNKMRSPETWTVYVDQIPVNWKKDKIKLEKDLHAPLTFEATITNRSGRAQDYAIKNLPEWMSVSNSFGTLNPQSEKTLTFSIHEGLNIGKYSRQIYVYNKAYDFNEKLLVTLEVKAKPPQWQVAEENFQYSMNITGQLAIDSVISHDPDDVVAAFVGNECRGRANVEYVKAYDMYEVFLDIYSHAREEENIKLRVWDASKNQIHADVTPKVTFNADKSLGSAGNPRMIYATEIILRMIPIHSGWNWLSFNLNSQALNNPDSLFADITFAVGNQIKTNRVYDQFDTDKQWKGSLSNSGGIRPEKMYMLLSENADTIMYTGLPLDPEDVAIPVEPGWNWIGYIPYQNLEINDALSSLKPATDDVIKSQKAFAMYDKQMGWLGSLKYLAPNQGYMLYAQDSDKLVYPARGLFSPRQEQKTAGKASSRPKPWEVNPSNFEHSMNIVARVKDQKQFIIHQQDYIGVFSGDKCVGVAKPVSVDATNQQVFFITAYSNKPENRLSFRYYDFMEGKIREIKDTLKFTLNQVKGTPKEPVILHLGNTMQQVTEAIRKSRVYPNPFSDHIRIRYYLNNPAAISIRIMDITGNLKLRRKYNNAAKGWNLIELDGKTDHVSTLPAGTYLIEVSTPDYTHVHRIIKSSN